MGKNLGQLAGTGYLIPSFCINLLSKDQEELSNICSDENKYDEIFILNEKNSHIIFWFLIFN